MKCYRYFIFFLICFPLLLSLTGCAAQNTVPNKPPLEIAVNSWPGFLPVILAEALGYFDAQGVDVQYFYGENSRQQRLDFESGAYDGITLSLGTLIAISGKATDTRVIFLTDISTTGDAVVANPNIESIADLKGKSIVLGSAGYGEVVVNVMLQQARLTSDEVVWVAMQDENEALEMLKDGRVDAFQTWEPFVTRAVQNGAKIIFTGADAPGLIPDAVGFHDKVLRERPEDVLAFMRGWFQAVEYWLANPEEATRILSKTTNLAPEELSLAGMELLTLERNQQFFQPGNDFSSVYYSAQIYADYFVKTGVIDLPLDVNTVLDDSFLLQLP